MNMGNMMVQQAVEVNDIMTMEGDGYRTLTFDVVAEIEVQQRHRMRWRGLRVPHLYDPSSKAKKRWSKALKDALDDIDMGSILPLFQPKPIKVELSFFWPHPDQKDLDNMVKFVLDAYEGLLYRNDNKVYEIYAKKAYGATSFVSAKFTMATS